MRSSSIPLSACLAFAACGGVATDPVADTTDLQEDAISTGTPAFVTLRHDARRCAAPLCGGFWLTDVNRPNAEVYVSGLDFSQSGLDEATIQQAQEGEDVVLFGRLGPLERRFRTRPLLVLRAFRGLPGVTRAPTDGFYSVTTNDPPIQCFAAPCNNDIATMLNRRFAPRAFTGVEPTRALLPFVDAAWAINQVERHGALVAAHFEQGDQMPAGRESLLVASQIYIELPYEQAPCPLPPIAQCPEGFVNVFSRTADRCSMPAGCVPEGGVCPRFFPTCDDGYTQASWTAAPNACPAYACDPTFTLPVEQPPLGRCARVRCAAGTHCVEEGPIACVPNATCASTLCPIGSRCVEPGGGDEAICVAETWTPEAVEVSSANPYRNNEQRAWVYTSELPNAAAVRLHFARFDLEARYDFVTIFAPDGAELSRFTGNLGEFTSPEYPFSSVRIVFTTDGSVTRSGFAIDRVDSRN